MADWSSSIWVDVTPTSGSTVNVPISDARTPIRLCLNNSGLLAAVTLNWPITAQDGQLVAISAKAAITLVTNTVTGGSIQGGPVGLGIGGNGIYVWRLANLTWYKFT